MEDGAEVGEGVALGEGEAAGSLAVPQVLEEAKQLPLLLPPPVEAGLLLLASIHQHPLRPGVVAEV